MRRRFICLFTAVAMIMSLFVLPTGAMAESTEKYTMVSEEYYEPLKADIVTYVHEYSGATVVLVENDDPECAFTIGYRTPMVDETDTNHVFEHAIIAGSGKYPAKDLFFDIANKSFSTFVNASTYQAFTSYMQASMSEEQLLKMADCYLSCMVDPTVMSDENIFKREAIRYQLYDTDGQIERLGSVYAEDSGFLTDIADEGYNAVLDALYPGEYASNRIGRANLEYRGLTYENTVATYERCYHFDNSLIIFYGDMDYDHVLEWLDDEYLSRYPVYGTDLSMYRDPVTAAGEVYVVSDVPAFEGDPVENAGIIYYAFDLDGLSLEDILAIDTLLSIETIDGSVLKNSLFSRGIYNQISCWAAFDGLKPLMAFEMYNANEDDAEIFREAVNEALEILCSEGEQEALLDIVGASNELETRLAREDTDIGVNIAASILCSWQMFGRTDVLNVERNFNERLADREAGLVEETAQKIKGIEHRALVAAVPREGLAEEILLSQEQEMAEIKSAMTDGEIQQMIEDSFAFDAWNAEENPSNDFLIDVSEIPEYESYGAYTVEKYDGITCITAPVEIEGVTRTQFMFDINALSTEEIMYLRLLRLLLGYVGTENLTADEVYISDIMLHPGMSATFEYPPESSEYAYPMISISWYNLAEEQNDAAALMLEMLLTGDYTDTEQILYVLESFMENYNPARMSAYDLASSYSETIREYSSNVRKYGLLTDQLYYGFLNDIYGQYMQGEGETVARRLGEVAEKVFHTERMILCLVGSEEELPTVKENTLELLSLLPKGEIAAVPGVELPEYERRMAVLTGDPDQYAYLRANLGNIPGRYLPFFALVNDKYIVPVCRFENGAYSAACIAGGTHDFGGLMLTYSDPNVGKTIDVFEGVHDFLSTVQFSEEEFNGYITNTMSGFIAPQGVISRAVSGYMFEIYGADLEQYDAAVNDIRNASAADLGQAAEIISEAFENSMLVIAGNEANIMREADRFDEIISYR